MTDIIEPIKTSEPEPRDPMDAHWQAFIAERDKLRERVTEAENRQWLAEVNVSMMKEACDGYLAHAANLRGENAKLKEEVERLRDACCKSNDEICQDLGKALGYPWFKDDQKTFPGATEENGVCVGEHVAESIAAEAAKRIAKLVERVSELEGALEEITRECDALNKGPVAVNIARAALEKIKFRNHPGTTNHELAKEALSRTSEEA
jgi:hypothetical protein